VGRTHRSQRRGGSRGRRPRCCRAWRGSCAARKFHTAVFPKSFPIGRAKGKGTGIFALRCSQPWRCVSCAGRPCAQLARPCPSGAVQLSTAVAPTALESSALPWPWPAERAHQSARNELQKYHTCRARARRCRRASGTGGPGRGGRTADGAATR
jgi:hypothetical protein